MADTNTERRKGERRYWLVKTEPNAFSFDDLVASKDGTTCWDGVRNYQARNFMRDGMKLGDLVLFYHSSVEPMAIVGTAEVAREAYPDHTAFDPREQHYDPKSDRASPTWMMVDLKARERFRHPLTLAELREMEGLEAMMLLQRGSRLSVQPVTAEEWKVIHKAGKPETIAGTRH